MSRIIDLNKYACDCCGKEYEEHEMCLIDGELICVECVEAGYEDSESMSDYRLSDWERNI